MNSEKLDTPPDFSSFRLAFFVCSLFSLAPLWVGKYLPMVDLPQHAAQISIIRHLHDPAFGFERQFSLHWFIPYSLSYFVGAQLLRFFSIFTTLRLLVSAAVLGLPLSVWALMKETGGDRWWSLIGFPLAYGYSFFWGFLSHIVAIPIGIYLVALAARHAREATNLTALKFAATSIFLFFGHALVFLVCMSIAGVILLGRIQRQRVITLFWPMLVALPIVIAWYVSPENAVPKVSSFVYWENPGPARIFRIAPLLLGDGTRISESIAVYVFAAVILLGARFKFFRWRFVAPAVTAFLLFALTPAHAMDISLIYQRFAVFAAIFALTMLRPTLSPPRQILSHVLLLIVVLGWSLHLLVQFYGFNQEARDFDSTLAHMEPNKSALAINFDTGCFYGLPQTYNHFWGYYQALKGGAYSFSFAWSYKSVARYKSGGAPLDVAPAAALGLPTRFNMRTYGGFDYYAVRSFRDRGEMFSDVGKSVVLDFHNGPWWLYRQVKS